jgi:virginiamycin B lyase
MMSDTIDTPNTLRIPIAAPAEGTAPRAAHAKTVAEYPLPAAGQTHEVAAVGANTLVISQQTNSRLVKVILDEATGTPRSAASFLIDAPDAGFHGLFASRTHPGCVWATVQFGNALLLIDPVAGDPDAEPRILARIPIPAPGRGPHVVVEYGDELWATCKDSSHVVRINASDPSDHTVYPALRKPIFVAKHPTSGDVYASQDQSSSILRIPAGGGAPVQMPVPAEQGSTPVGLVQGPDGNVWFVLLGGSTGGNGRFGRINANASIDWFGLKTKTGTNAGLLHLGFDENPDAANPRVWLLGSSISAMGVLNAVFRVTFTPGWEAIDTQQTFTFPTQFCMAHRVLARDNGIFATEMMTSLLVHVPASATATQPPVDETSDAYGLWGLGVPTTRIDY